MYPRFGPRDRRASQWRRRTFGHINVDDKILDGLNAQPIHVFDVPEGPSTGLQEGISPKYLRTLSSYSWSEEREPTIIVPGSPRKWLDRDLPFQVNQNAGTQSIDPKSPHNKNAGISPHIPIILAVDHLQPQYDWSSVDVLSERSNLWKLFTWLCEKVDRQTGNMKRKEIQEQASFRINAELVGETLVLSRWDREATEQASFGYNIDFGEAATTDVEGSGSSRGGNHRIIEYDFGGLKILLRFVVDAFQDVTSVTATNEAGSEAGIEIGVNAERANPESFAGVQVISAGRLVPHESILEYKTRNYLNAQGFNWAGVIPHMFLSQTPSMFLAIHKKGEFFEIRKRALHELDEIAEDNCLQEKSFKLRVLLEQIKRCMIDKGTKRMVIVCHKGGLGAYEQELGHDGPSLIPESLHGRFARGVQQGVRLD